MGPFCFDLNKENLRLDLESVLLEDVVGFRGRAQQQASVAAQPVAGDVVVAIAVLESGNATLIFGCDDGFVGEGGDVAETDCAEAIGGTDGGFLGLRWFDLA